MRTLKRMERRRGFTLVEMLVVLAIIVVLVSLTTVAAFRLIGTQQKANTNSELNKVQMELQKQYRAAADKFANEPIPYSGAQGAVYSTVTQMAGGDKYRARVIWVKLRLKQTFPQTLNEALAPNPMPALPGYQTYLSSLGFTTANTTSPQPWESSACLLMALQRGEEGGGVTPEVLGVNSYVQKFPTPSGGTIPALVDGWGNTIFFARWPVNSTVLNPRTGQPLPKDNNDAGDHSGLLESTAWQATAGYTWFTQPPANPQLPYPIGHPVPQHPANTEATSYRVFPLVASAGPDQQLGLNPFTFLVTNAGQADDNQYPTIAPPSE